MCIADMNMVMSRILASDPEGNGQPFLSGSCVDTNSVLFSYRQLPNLLVQLYIMSTASFLDAVVSLEKCPGHLTPKYFSVFVLFVFFFFSSFSQCPGQVMSLDLCKDMHWYIQTEVRIVTDSPYCRVTFYSIYSQSMICNCPWTEGYFPPHDG